MQSVSSKQFMCFGVESYAEKRILCLNRANIGSSSPWEGSFFTRHLVSHNCHRKSYLIPFRLACRVQPTEQETVSLWHFIPSLSFPDSIPLPFSLNNISLRKTVIFGGEVGRRWRVKWGGSGYMFETSRTAWERNQASGPNYLASISAAGHLFVLCASSTLKSIWHFSS